MNLIFYFFSREFEFLFLGLGFHKLGQQIQIQTGLWILVNLCFLSFDIENDTVLLVVTLCKYIILMGKSVITNLYLWLFRCNILILRTKKETTLLCGIEWEVRIIGIGTNRKHMLSKMLSSYFTIFPAQKLHTIEVQ